MTGEPMSLTLLLLFAYILGSVPFGLALGKVCCHVDLREHGSGNIGASNAWRVLGWKVGLPVFVLDLLKGFIPVLAGRLVSEHRSWASWAVVGAGMFAILGHNVSPFLKFKGGKGVATSLGVALGLSWKAALAGFAAWAVVLALTGFISVASLVGTPVGAYLIWYLNGGSLPYALFAILATAFVVVKHIPNMRRLVVGRESSISWALLSRIRKK